MNRVLVRFSKSFLAVVVLSDVGRVVFLKKMFLLSLHLQVFGRRRLLLPVLSSHPQPGPAGEVPEGPRALPQQKDRLRGGHEDTLHQRCRGQTQLTPCAQMSPLRWNVSPLCFSGLSIHTFHGNFFVRSTDLLSLANVNPDSAFAVQMSIEDSLADSSLACFQAALLYTSSKGEHKTGVQPTGPEFLFLTQPSYASAPRERLGFTRIQAELLNMFVLLLQGKGESGSTHCVCRW